MKHKLNKILIAGTIGLLLTGSVSPLVTQVRGADLSKFGDGGYVSTHWSSADVNYALDHGWINGIADTSTGIVNLDVNGTVTRAQYIKMLLDLLDPGLSKSNAYLHQWDEVDGVYQMQNNDSLPVWYGEYANMWANMTGDFDLNTVEYWNAPINRNEIAAFMCKAVRDLSPELLASTQNNVDNLISDRYSKEYNSLIAWNDIEQLYSNGIMTGKENNAFKPYDNATRGEACAVLRRLTDLSARLTVEIPEDKAEDRYDYVDREAMTIYQNDPNRRSVQEGDTFIDLNGTAWTVTLNTQTGTYNPTDAVAFDLGRENSLGQVYVLGSGSNGTGGGTFGDILVQAPNGHVNWTSEFEKIYASGFDKPTTNGTTNGQLSEHKYWVWSTTVNKWIQNDGFMYNY